jgi:DNA-binding MarR family transcriptional regulator
MSARTENPTSLAATLRVSISRLNRRLRAERADGAEVSLGALAVLARLHRDGVTTSGALATLEGVRPPSMTRIVATLESDGLVARSAHPDDGRQQLVAITPRGAEVLQTDRRRREAWLARALTDLTPQERRLLAAAAPLLERLSTSGP